MNESGRSVGEALRFYKIEAGGAHRLPRRTRSRALPGEGEDRRRRAGHNGLRSIEAASRQDYRRVRIGIGHPGHKDRVTGYVLGNYAKAEMDDLADMLGAIGRGALAGGGRRYALHERDRAPDGVTAQAGGSRK
jgi:PTH1 family peptidyl-tRNA hydrolase